MAAGFHVEALDAERYRQALPGLAFLLVDAVESGAGVSFLEGLDLPTAEAFWARQMEAVADGTVTPFVASEPGTGLILGSVLLIRSRTPNAPHRAEIAKVLTLQRVRGRGIATALMQAAEARARADGRWLLILDTTPDGTADRLYRRLGWQEVGSVPGYALSVKGVPVPTTFFFKDLR